MNSFTNRPTRQCIVPGIILGVFSFSLPCILEVLGFVELGHGYSGLIYFNIYPLLIVVPLILVRLSFRSRKQFDSNSSIATLFLYLTLSLSYMMFWAIKLQYCDRGALMPEWAFVATTIFQGLLVCWSIYCFALMCISVCRQNSTKSCVYFLLKSFLKAFILFTCCNVLPIILCLWPLLIIGICKIAFWLF